MLGSVGRNTFLRGGDERDPDSYHVHVQCMAAWESERHSCEAARALPAAGGDGMMIARECDWASRRGPA